MADRKKRAKRPTMSSPISLIPAGYADFLARDLRVEFPGRNGFSAQNIWLMRQFYLEYRDKPNLAPLVREISWAKNLLILGRCKDDLAREYFSELLLFHRRSGSSFAVARRRPSSSTRCAPRRAPWAWRPTPSCRSCRRTTGRICQARSRSPSGSGRGMGLGAGIVRVHPALVAGRVRKECGNYRLLSEVANAKGVRAVWGLET